MQIYDIKNPRVLALLDRLVYLYREKYDVANTNTMLGQWSDDPETWLCSSYRDAIIEMGSEHLGGPPNARSYALKPEHYNGDDSQYKKDFNDIDERIKTELGIRVNALSQLYPPEGFIAWHNNANASGYNLIFTWSETGDGWFKYVDENGNEITMHDKKGWSLKAGYFGNYEDERTCYHAAYTKCWRMTHSFVVAQDEDYWLDCLDYISSE